MAKLGIIADDLSGACDAAAEFACRDFPCLVDLEGTLDAVNEVDVLAVSTETRMASASEASAKVIAAFERMRRAGIATIYKKIDSTLRGNCRVEIDALLCTSGFERAVILPAFPEMRRSVRSGSLYVNDDPSPAFHIPALLGEQNLRCITSDECKHQIALGKGLFVVDASNRDELRQAAQFLWTRLAGTLLVGSAGIAAEIAELMRKDAGATHHAPTPPFTATGKPLFFAIGSTHDQTAAQVDFLKRSQKIEFIDLEATWDSRARQKLLDNKDVVLSIDCNRIDFSHLRKLRKLVGKHLISALIATGGYTARLVCETLQARAIRVRRSLLPGIAIGMLIGGDSDGLPIVTKSGGFGTAGALAEIPRLLRDERAA